MQASRPIRVLVVDDSAVVRRLISDALAGDAGIEVVGTAPDPYVARDKILELAPDVLTLDIEMPRMDGLSFLKRIMHYHPLPVIIISSLGRSGCEASLEALRLGAVEVLAKPAGPYSIGELSAVLAQKVRAAAQSVIRQRGAGERRAGVTEEASSATSEARRQDQGESLLRVNPAALRRHLVAIGSSTGGTQAIEALLGRFSGDCPPMVIVQHIPAGFSRAFADRLNACLPMEVKEASPGDEIRFGRVLIAPGNFHLVVERGGSGYRVGIKDGPLVCYQRPSVDVMFRSVANVAGADCVAAILTGMGSDGAQGMKRVREAGGWTIAQDEASCVVYGMPREAVKVGAVEESAPLEAIPERILAGLAKAPGRNERLSSTRLA